MTNRMRFDSTSTHETRHRSRQEGAGLADVALGLHLGFLSSFGGCECLTATQGFTRAISWWNRNI